MCKYCEDDKTIMEIESISPSTAYFCGGIKEDEIDNITYRSGVFIDNRGCLRLVDLDDCNCLDGGEKIEISFCPFCGEKMNKETKK